MTQDLFRPPEITPTAMVSCDLRDFLEALSHRCQIFWLYLSEVRPDGDYNLCLQQGPNCQRQYLRVYHERQEGEDAGMQLLVPEVWAEILAFLTEGDKGKSAEIEDEWVKGKLTDGSEVEVMLRVVDGKLSEVLESPLPSFYLPPQA